MRPAIWSSPSTRRCAHEHRSIRIKARHHEGAERSRIWIEGNRLAAVGFIPGELFEREWTATGLKLYLIDAKAWAALPVAQRGTVSGKAEKPIIDIVGALVRSTFGDHATHVRVTFAPAVITIAREAAR